jgi:molybdopterin converting factor subunit 1
VNIRVKLFAILRDRAGVSEFELSLDEGATCADALRAIGDRFPALVQYLDRAACAVDQEYAPRETILRAGQELALIPPVSGG